jgi:hypothetical protein
MTAAACTCLTIGDCMEHGLHWALSSAANHLLMVTSGHEL